MACDFAIRGGTIVGGSDPTMVNGYVFMRNGEHHVARTERLIRRTTVPPMIDATALEKQP